MRCRASWTAAAWTPLWMGEAAGATIKTQNRKLKTSSKAPRSQVSKPGRGGPVTWAAAILSSGRTQPCGHAAFGCGARPSCWSRRDLRGPGACLGHSAVWNFGSVLSFVFRVLNLDLAPAASARSRRLSRLVLWGRRRSSRRTPNSQATPLLTIPSEALCARAGPALWRATAWRGAADQERPPHTGRLYRGGAPARLTSPASARPDCGGAGTVLTGGAAWASMLIDHLARRRHHRALFLPLRSASRSGEFATALATRPVCRPRDRSARAAAAAGRFRASDP